MRGERASRRLGCRISGRGGSVCGVSAGKRKGEQGNCGQRSRKKAFAHELLRGRDTMLGHGAARDPDSSSDDKLWPGGGLSRPFRH